MAELGERVRVGVVKVGKYKTFVQMLAIGFMLYREQEWFIDPLLIGEWMLYLAAALTVWSMLVYLRAAWPIMVERNGAASSTSAVPEEGRQDA